MAFVSKETPCAEVRTCFYETWNYDKGLDIRVKCCRILDCKTDDPPYKSGECAFYKEGHASISGSYEGEQYTPEMIDKIRNKEFEYKLAHGIIGKRGRV